MKSKKFLKWKVNDRVTYHHLEALVGYSNLFPFPWYRTCPLHVVSLCVYGLCYVATNKKTSNLWYVTTNKETSNLCYVATNKKTSN